MLVLHGTLLLHGHLTTAIATLLTTVVAALWTTIVATLLTTVVAALLHGHLLLWPLLRVPNIWRVRATNGFCD